MYGASVQMLPLFISDCDRSRNIASKCVWVLTGHFQKYRAG